MVYDETPSIIINVIITMFILNVPVMITDRELSKLLSMYPIIGFVLSYSRFQQDEPSISSHFYDKVSNRYYRYFYRHNWLTLCCSHTFYKHYLKEQKQLNGKVFFYESMFKNSGWTSFEKLRFALCSLTYFYLHKNNYIKIANCKTRASWCGRFEQNIPTSAHTKEYNKNNKKTVGFKSSQELILFH